MGAFVFLKDVVLKTNTMKLGQAFFCSIRKL